MFKYIQLKPKLEECLHISLHITKSFDCSSSFSVLSPLTKEAYKAGKSIQNPHKINERLSFNLLFLLFNVSMFFFYWKGCSPLNISDQRLQNGRFIFLKNRFFKVVARDSPASKLSYLGGRSEPRENTWVSGEAARCRFPCTPLSRLLSRASRAFTFHDRWGMWAVSAEHCSQDMQKTLRSSHVKTELGTRLNCFDCRNNVHHVR